MDEVLALDRFRETGCLIVDRLFDPALIDRVHEEYLRQYRDGEAARAAPHKDVGDKRLHLPVELTGALLDPMLLFHPLLRMMIKQLMPTRLQIDSVNIVTAFPGSPDQRIHRDHAQLFGGDDPADRSPPFAIAVGIPLVDLDAEIGGTRLYPGSMAVPNRDQLDRSRSVVPFVARGGCYLYDYRLYHAGLANRSTIARPILFVTFARHWFSDTVNFRDHARIVVREDAVRALPRDSRKLLGRLASPGAFDLPLDELLGDPA